MVDLKNVVMLAADTTRSQAYLQALAEKGLRPQTIFLMGKGDPRPAAARPRAHWRGIHLPDFRETLGATCDRLGARRRFIASRDVNSPAVAARLRRAKPAYVIYSGYGGQIVKDAVLGLGARFLHLHAGWLPRYRGSTTIYYSLLEKKSPAVSALFLDRTIDTGPVVARRHYPIPEAGLDVDHLYDSAIRADLLARVAGRFARTGSFGTPRKQTVSRGLPYYVIHPVLRHVARLALEARA